MAFPFRTLAAAGAMALALTNAALGQQMHCNRAEAGDAFLASEYGGHPLFDGVAANGAAIRLFLNPSSGTWSVIIYPEEGVGCLMMSGEAGQPAKPGKPAKAAPQPKGKGA
jgi:hypothetical protein